MDFRERKFLVLSRGGFVVHTLDLHCDEFEKILQAGTGDDLYFAIAIGINSAMERYVRAVAADIQTIGRLPLKLSDFEGSWIRKSKKYFNGLCGFDSPTEADWKELEKIYWVRNVLAHDYGNVDEIEDSGLKKKNKWPPQRAT